MQPVTAKVIFPEDSFFGDGWSTELGIVGFTSFDRGEIDVILEHLFRVFNHIEDSTDAPRSMSVGDIIEFHLPDSDYVFSYVCGRQGWVGYGYRQVA